MIQSWENLVTDGQTDESDFIRRCLTNAERLKNKTNERSFDFLKLLRWLLRHFPLIIFSMDSIENICHHSLQNLGATKKCKNGDHNFVFSLTRLR